MIPDPFCSDYFFTQSLMENVSKPERFPIFRKHSSFTLSSLEYQLLNHEALHSLPVIVDCWRTLQDR